jgi:PPOX class probable F420-dependent enzyme
MEPTASRGWYISEEMSGQWVVGLSVLVDNLFQSKMQLLSPTVRRFLGKPRLARLCTVGPDGYPHIVPMYFMRQGDDIVFGSDRDERKVRNALANPKAAVVVGGDPGTDESGYMIQGGLTIEDDPDHAILTKLLRRYESKEEVEQHLAEWAERDTVVIRLKPKRVIRVW